ncbi:hypothetical protein SKAU_G00267330 [Synaphobranchus kaupii]|uniref:Ig-like domain-containing protein n=1 Tax=Synaphobranchus kaupii TaxID=118154 RepID=A0A9Q1EZH5_SYNKA|nr:hypothetical protein SKAU_G00267330 [Synaphobranchus kaupii]
MSAFGALLILTATSQVTASACRPEHNRTVQCYGALGESVFLHLGVASKDAELRVNGKEKNILNYKSDKFTRYKLTNSSQFFINWTLRLDSVLKNDSEEYEVVVHSKEGILQFKSKIQLIIQAPLSEPVISQLCLPHGEVRVSCSSDGDVTEYNWTLGHKPLDGGAAYLKDEKNTVILKKNVSGNITCSVWNHVSHNLTTVRLSACPAPWICTLPNGTEVTVSMKTTEDFQSMLIIKVVLISIGGRENISVVCNNTSLTVGLEKINQGPDTGVMCVGITTVSVVICVAFTLFALTAAMYCFNRQRNRTAVTDEGDNSAQELVYTEVDFPSRVKGGRGREREREQESRTVYGQIKVPQAPNHTEGKAYGEEDAVYARVHKNTTGQSQRRGHTDQPVEKV